MELKLLDLFGTKCIGASPKEFGELGHMANVAIDSYLRVVSALQFLLHAPA
jgi:hypothetical protein